MVARDPFSCGWDQQTRLGTATVTAAAPLMLEGNKVIYVMHLEPWSAHGEHREKVSCCHPLCLSVFMENMLLATEIIEDQHLCFPSATG